MELPIGVREMASSYACLTAYRDFVVDSNYTWIAERKARREVGVRRQESDRTGGLRRMQRFPGLDVA